MEGQANNGRRKGKKVLIKIGIASLLIGSIGGTGAAVYTGLKDASTRLIRERYENKIRELEDKKEELENKFYGPLDTLTKISEKSSVSPLEKRLYAFAYLGTPLDEILQNNPSTIYEHTVGNNVKLIVKGVITPVNSSFSNGDLFLVKMFADDSDVSSIYYFSKKNSSSATLGNIMDEVSPAKIITFERGGIKVIDFEKAKVIKIIDNKISYLGTDISTYKTVADRVLKEFKELYKRGPNTPEKIE